MNFWQWTMIVFLSLRIISMLINASSNDPKNRAKATSMLITTVFIFIILYGGGFFK